MSTNFKHPVQNRAWEYLSGGSTERSDALAALVKTGWFADFYNTEQEAGAALGRLIESEDDFKRFCADGKDRFKKAVLPPAKQGAQIEVTLIVDIEHDAELVRRGYSFSSTGEDADSGVKFARAFTKAVNDALKGKAISDRRSVAGVTYKSSKVTKTNGPID